MTISIFHRHGALPQTTDCGWALCETKNVELSKIESGITQSSVLNTTIPMFVLATTCSSWFLTDQQVVTSNLLLSIAAQSAHKVQDKWNYSGECSKVLKSIPLLSLMFSALHAHTNLFHSKKLITDLYIFMLWFSFIFGLKFSKPV